MDWRCKRMQVEGQGVLGVAREEATLRAESQGQDMMTEEGCLRGMVINLTLKLGFEVPEGHLVCPVKSTWNLHWKQLR